MLRLLMNFYYLSLKSFGFYVPTPAYQVSNLLRRKSATQPTYIEKLLIRLKERVKCISAALTVVPLK